MNKFKAIPNCFRLLLQATDCALAFARDNAGNNTAARIAMMAMTTRSSIRVKADGREICGCLPLTRFVRLRRVMLYTACCHFRMSKGHELALFVPTTSRLD